MKKNLLNILFALSLASPILAQQKLLTMEDVVLNSRTSLAPKQLNQLVWIKESNEFSYVDVKNDIETLVKGSPEKLERSAILSLLDLNVQLRNIKTDTLIKFPSIAWKDRDQLSFETNTQSILYTISTKKLQAVPLPNLSDSAQNKDIESRTKTIAYTIENNLFVFKDNKKYQITKDSEKNIVNGQSVHRDEFGIYKGTFWSPNGNLLAFYRMDQTMVTDYPVIDWTTRPAKADLIKYPMAGDKSHQVTIGVYNAEKQTTIFLKTGEPAEQYLTNIAWSPDEKYIYVVIVNRDQNYLRLNRYKAETGEFEKTLFEEKDEKYVQPLHPILFVKNNPNEFIWQSRRDGYNHLYLYDTDGKLIRQLTKGNWEVMDLIGFDNKAEKVFYISTSESPINRDLHSVYLKNAAITRISNGKGTHNILFNEYNNCFIDNFMSTDVPREVKIINDKSKTLQLLLKAENPLKDFKLGAVKNFTIKNKQGDELYCRQINPVDFDSTKKYPVFVYLYGGPGVQLIMNTWPVGGDLWYQYMAEKGFVVFTLDNRGSANRGKAFEQATFRNLGTTEMEDQLLGVDYLKTLSFVDTNRIGVNGWSFGGFLTTSLMTRHPGVFKVAVAGGPVIDWSYYEVMYTERYMDTPQSNKQGYDNNNLLNYVDKLQGKLMLIHGTSDDVVVWQHSLMYLKKAVDKGIPIDYFVYPGHLHNVRGKDRVHLLNKMTDYFIENL